MIHLIQTNYKYKNNKLDNAVMEDASVPFITTIDYEMDFSGTMK